MTETAPFADRLLAWFDDHGRHDLPWQNPRSPYRVWVSEVMLQQTQVATVIPYFERWMAVFPDLARLAAAEVDEVLAHWSGLGYYARARNLHAAARACMTDYAGELPDDPAVLASLPGIGESTANAIVAQAHDTPLPILDGNAKRVLARHAAIAGWPGRAPVLRSLWAAAKQRLPDARGADYAQAIMDLGATLCTRSAPDCAACPVRTDCKARRAGIVGEIPGRKPRAAVPERVVYLLVLRREDGAVLLERRPSAGIWGGLWSLPEADAPDRFADRFGRVDFATMPEREHRLTHRVLKLRPVAASIAGRDVRENGDQAWTRPTDWSELGLPKPIQTLLASLDDRVA